MKINRLIESLIKDYDVNLETKEDGIKAFKEYDVFEKDYYKIEYLYN